ncbi:MAG: DNA-3-methyladenine glycosylase [Bowdeniella nasicola]|nr:DNA-3-methyladenine glycosylase [Bowdeniella nasicola]
MVTPASDSDDRGGGPTTEVRRRPPQGESSPPTWGADLRAVRGEDLAVHPVEVAPRLLGAVLMVDDVAIRLTEVEAYCGPGDPGSHAYRRLTPRTRVMAGPVGSLYVYFSYGMHHAVNIVAHEAGEVGAVLLRAGEVVAGVTRAEGRRREIRRARGQSVAPLPHAHLARGPGNLAAALGLTRADSGARLDSLTPGTNHSSRLYHLLVPTTPVGSVRETGRTGVSGPGGDPENYPWRFALRGEASVSAYRRA